MAQILGMDPQAVRELARQLDQSAGQIEQIRSQLTSKLSGTQWVGNDAQQFRSDWESTHVSKLNEVIGALRQASQTANRNAQAQEQTSSAL
ncbi:WXG100 family type VII secretion target [Tessaracoccus caeni]|uniref:WXG100 family type VII secretion target n=1 Tax=Tessaracoccus caeni TaxID=3031239 RepID=UPI0023DB10A3|nr:WXG100 family type VII secretion target [Tessaracoccus caeni]MDF1487701.1 WXG100 family type VII secretion target [Tessaracoccus caeni]